MYQTTIRATSKDEIQLLNRVKNSFCPTSLSKAILRMAREYYQMRETLDRLEKATTIKYEISSDVIKKIFGGRY